MFSKAIAIKSVDRSEKSRLRNEKEELYL
jgi:hypothetical protein